MKIANISALCLLALGACEQRPDSGQNKETFFSEDEVKKLVVPGMSEEALRNRFGKPSFEYENDEGSRTFAYIAPNQPKSRGVAFTGFQVRISSNKVVRWTPIRSAVIEATREKEASIPVPRSNGKTPATNILLFVVHDKATTSGSYVDTPLFPKLGFIDGKPDLVIDSLESIAEGESTLVPLGSTSTTLILGLTPADASAFEKLTERNVGRRILFMFGTNVILAPFVQESIRTSKVTIKGQSPENVLELRTQLQTLVR